MRLPERLPASFLLALLLAAAAGFAGGRLLFTYSLSAVPLKEVPDARQPMAVLDLEGVEKGALVGKLTGEARILVHGQAVPVAADGEVRLPLAGLPAVVTVTVPAGMRFVASKTGKKYYDVSSPEAGRLALATRVYFPDEASAEAAGYVR